MLNNFHVSFSLWQHLQYKQFTVSTCCYSFDTTLSHSWPKFVDIRCKLFPRSRWMLLIKEFECLDDYFYTFLFHFSSSCLVRITVQVKTPNYDTLHQTKFSDLQRASLQATTAAQHLLQRFRDWVNPTGESCTLKNDLKGICLRLLPQRLIHKNKTENGSVNGWRLKMMGRVAKP